MTLQLHKSFIQQCNMPQTYIKSLYFLSFTDHNVGMVSDSAERNDNNDISFFENADELFTQSNGIYLDTDFVLDFASNLYNFN